MNLICISCSSAIATNRSDGKLCNSCNLSIIPVEQQTEDHNKNPQPKCETLLPAKKVWMDG